MDDCGAKIRPLPNETELRCEVEGSHTRHQATLRDYAYPGSATTVVWLETDRRNFRDDWARCIVPGCVLPAAHRGNHLR